MEEIKKQITLEEFLEKNQVTKQEWKKTVDEVLQKGISKGCFEDYDILTLVIQWLFNYKTLA